MRRVGGARLAPLGLVLALVVSACAGTGTGLVTVTDPARLSRLEVPSDWNVYDLDTLSTLDGFPFNQQVQGITFPVITAVGFDGGPSPDVTRLALDLTDADYPIGATSVRRVGELGRDFLSRAVLTQSVIPYFGYNNPQELTKEDFSFGAGFDGVRVLVAFEDDTGSSQGVAYMISVSNPEDTRIFSIVAGCNRECFIANQDVITKVVDSWLVNKRG